MTGFTWWVGGWVGVWVEKSPQTINLQTELKYLNWFKIYSI